MYSAVVIKEVLQLKREALRCGTQWPAIGS